MGTSEWIWPSVRATDGSIDRSPNRLPRAADQGSWHRVPFETNISMRCPVLPKQSFKTSATRSSPSRFHVAGTAFACVGSRSICDSSGA